MGIPVKFPRKLGFCPVVSQPILRFAETVEALEQP